MPTLLEAEAVSQPEADREYESDDEEENGPGHVPTPPTRADRGPTPQHALTCTSVAYDCNDSVTQITLLTVNQIRGAKYPMTHPTGVAATASTRWDRDR